jgi:hypothetical protein
MRDALLAVKKWHRWQDIVFEKKPVENQSCRGGHMDFTLSTCIFNRVLILLINIVIWE